MEEKKVILRSGRKGRIKPGHPWIYKGQVRKTDPRIKPGGIVVVADSEGKFIGRGYYNPRSEIAIRILSFEDESIGADFFCKRVKEAYKRREHLLSSTNAFRVLFSEADGLPGLIADLYFDTVVFQILTLGMENLKCHIVDSLRSELKPKHIYEKSESTFRKMEGLRNTKRWQGEPGRTKIEIFEGKARFIVDIENGHKTGFYLDQRKSRLALENISKGKKVLDLFCYTGAFSVSAALYGAADVRGVDIKEDLLALARRNAELNSVSERTKFACGDAFSALRSFFNSGEKFDIIIIDPPSFTRTKRSVPDASKGYKELNLTAMKTLAEGGVLATFSCSHNMSNEAFSDMLKHAARDAGKRFGILRRCHQAADHPVAKNVPESEYLKGYFLKIHSA
jgi:23S rRNA (cytosine1962-C5)-methyltransferase